MSGAIPDLLTDQAAACFVANRICARPKARSTVFLTRCVRFALGVIGVPTETVSGACSAVPVKRGAQASCWFSFVSI